MDPRSARRGTLSRRSRRPRIRVAGAALAGSFLTACGSAATATPPSTATARPTATPGASAAAVETRLLVQQGLGIGLASNVVQSQVTVLLDVLLGSTSCNALEAGTGSSKVLQKSTTGNVTTASIYVYYDGSCAQPYVEVAATLTAGTGGYAITETDTYLGPGGATLGTLALSENVLLSLASGATSNITVNGTGTFTAHDGAPAVSLGLECTIPSGSTTPPPFVCSGAVAQPFPAVNESLGSVAPITITLTPLSGGSGDDYGVAFAGTQSTSESGALGALTITSPTSTTLAIGGSGTAMPSHTTSGHAALFALFSPAPTGWTVTDASSGSVFSLTLVSSTQLTGTVTTASGASLAHLTLDQSGSGTISYAGGGTASITSWTLGG